MRRKLRDKIGRKKRGYTIMYLNKAGSVKESYIWAYSENEAIKTFTERLPKAEIVSIDEFDEWIW